MKITTGTNIGGRAENQDFCGVHGDSVFAIADGHGDNGGEIAKNIIEEIIWNEIKPERQEILKLFNTLSEKYRDFGSGSTLSVVWSLKNGKFLVAILGDSPVWYLRNGKVFGFPLHNVSDNLNDDIKLLKKRKVEFYQSWSGHLYQKSMNSGHLLQLTRSIGDLVFGENVSKIPDIYEIEAEAVVICSDGFTGRSKEVKKLLDKKAKSSDFIENQKDRGIQDNITVIAIYD